MIYLDHAATTPLHPLVLEAMMPFLTEDFGNASSVHALGRRARFAVEESREKVASFIGAEPGEVLFTSGGTEANNTALRGMVGPGRGLLTCAAEHESILRPAEALGREGYDVRIVAPGPTGALNAREVEAQLTGDPVLVSLMHANNEIGTLTSIEEIVDVAHLAGAAVHCDAVQTAGFGLMRVDDVAVDLLTISGHKFYGPKGIGVLYVRAGTDIEPLIVGGAQERRRRGGTENVPAIVGFAEAMKLALAAAGEIRENISRLRDRLLDGLRSMLGDAFVLNTP
ncbi:MAG: cysteine desulfurase family protein, partial [Rhodothermales bacterium]